MERPDAGVPPFQVASVSCVLCRIRAEKSARNTPLSLGSSPTFRKYAGKPATTLVACGLPMQET